jgi:uncharacterized protein (DUF697 family)
MRRGKVNRNEDRGLAVVVAVGSVAGGVLCAWQGDYLIAAWLYALGSVACGYLAASEAEEG